MNKKKFRAFIERLKEVFAIDSEGTGTAWLSNQIQREIDKLAKEFLIENNEVGNEN